MFKYNLVMKLLKENSYSQSALAKYLNMPPTTLNDKLHGRTKFTADEAYKIAKFFNRGMEYFYE